MSNLWSCVSTQMAVVSSTGTEARWSCGHRVTTSWASGNRSGRLNAGRASQTTTR